MLACATRHRLWLPAAWALLCWTGICVAQAQAPGPTRSLVDAAGRTVVIPAKVNRVADPWHANNAMVLMLGGADKLVATSWQAQRQPWFEKLYPPYANIPAVFNAAGDVNIEALVATRPDVILMAYGGVLPKWLGAVEALHIPVVMMPSQTLADLKTTARMTGEIIGEVRAAEEYIRYFEGNIRRVASATANIPPQERLKVLHTATSSIFNIDGRDSVVDDWIRLAGATNAATVVGNARAVSLEQIIAWDPDVIIVGTAPNLQNRQAILDDPRWGRIKAVKTGRVYVNPAGAYLWDRHSAEAALQVLWAAKTLYPARFGSIDIKAETLQFYEKFFHHSLTDTEYRSIIDATAP